MATVKGAEGDFRVGEEDVTQKLYEGRCVWNGSRGGSEREAITLRVVFIKKFSTLPFTVKNMKLCTNN